MFHDLSAIPTTFELEDQESNTCRSMAIADYHNTFMTLAIMSVIFGQIFGQMCGSPCPTDWTLYRDSCYLFVDDGKSYLEAEEVCYSLSYFHRQSHLTSVVDHAEASFLANLAQTSITSSAFMVWIGYDDLNDEGIFKWRDNSTSTLNDNWIDFNPDDYRGDEDCATIFAENDANDGKFNDYNCESTLPFICKMRRRGFV